MSELRVKFERSLRSVPESRLAAITAQELAFANRDWLRMLEQLDLSSIVGGEVDLQFAVVEAGNVPVAVCPIVSARGPDVVASYNFRRYYFKHFFREIPNENSKKTARIARFAAMYERLLDGLRCSLDEIDCVCSPLSYRTQLAMAGDAACSPHEISRALISGLQGRAYDVGQPVCFYSVGEDDEVLSRDLEEAGFLRVFGIYDNYINLSGFRSFDDYLQTFKSKTRWRLRNERRKVSASGVAIRSVSDIDEYAETISRQYTATYSKYGPSYLKHPADFWVSLSRFLGDRLEVVLATRESRHVAVSLLLKCEKQREMWLYRIGRDYDVPDGSSLYFDMAFYQPIERAIQCGYQRYWLGPGGYEAKLRRGAVPVPFYSWYWFPKKRDRWLLSGYLSRFGEGLRQEIGRQMSHPAQVADGDE